VTTLADIEARKQRAAASLATIAFLVRSTDDLEKIGRRAVLLNYLMHRSEENQITQRELARRLRTCESAISERLAAGQAALDELFDPKFSSSPENH